MILIGNKIDLRQGQVTNQGLEDGEFESRRTAILVNTTAEAMAPSQRSCRSCRSSKKSRLASSVLLSSLLTCPKSSTLPRTLFYTQRHLYTTLENT